MRSGILGAVLITPVLVAVALGQALDVSSAVDLGARVVADREGCLSADCLRLTVSVRNLAAQERFVPRQLVDVGWLQLSSAAGEFRLQRRSGGAVTGVLERLDAIGGAKDELTETYTLPGCCVVYDGSDRVDMLPRGTYTVTYEAVARSGAEDDAADQGALRSEPATFAVGPDGAMSTNDDESLDADDHRG